MESEIEGEAEDEDEGEGGWSNQSEVGSGNMGQNALTSNVPMSGRGSQGRPGIIGGDVD